MGYGCRYKGCGNEAATLKEKTKLTENKGHGATLPRAQSHQRAVDTLQERSLVVLPVVHRPGMVMMVDPRSMVLICLSSLCGPHHRWPRSKLDHDAVSMAFFLILLIVLMMVVRLVLVQAHRRVKRSAGVMRDGRSDGGWVGREVARETHSTKHARDTVLHAGTEVANASGGSEAGLRVSSHHFRWAGVGGCVSETKGRHFGC